MNCWVPQIGVGSQQLSLLRGQWCFLIHFGFRRLVCAIRFFGKVRFSVRGGYSGFPRCHELLIGRVAQLSANAKMLRCALVLPWQSLLACIWCATVNGKVAHAVHRYFFGNRHSLKV